MCITSHLVTTSIYSQFLRSNRCDFLIFIRTFQRIVELGEEIFELHEKLWLKTF